MPRDRGRYGGRGDYETDDLRYRERQGAGFGSGRYWEDQGRRQYQGEQFAGGQQGGWEGSEYGERGQGGYGQAGYDEWSRGGDRNYPGYGSARGRGYEGGFSGYGHSGERSYGGGERGWSERGRGFIDKASDEVSSWFGDEDAERRRRQDQFRGRGPKGYVRSDERIREEINDRLTDDWSLDATDIEVEVEEREVTLSGEVGSRADKRRAEDIAESVSGVLNVQNNLRVKQQATEGSSTPSV
jgi:osmotically-inducible protein OsmY